MSLQRVCVKMRWRTCWKPCTATFTSIFLLPHTRWTSHPSTLAVPWQQLKAGPKPIVPALHPRRSPDFNRPTEHFLRAVKREFKQLPRVIDKPRSAGFYEGMLKKAYNKCCTKDMLRSINKGIIPLPAFSGHTSAHLALLAVEATGPLHASAKYHSCRFTATNRFCELSGSCSRATIPCKLALHCLSSTPANQQRHVLTGELCLPCLPPCTCPAASCGHIVKIVVVLSRRGLSNSASRGLAFHQLVTSAVEASCSWLHTQWALATPCSRFTS
jgi:hypothetical protein